MQFVLFQAVWLQGKCHLEGGEWSGCAAPQSPIHFTGCPSEVAGFTDTSGGLRRPSLLGKQCLSRTDGAAWECGPSLPQRSVRAASSAPHSHLCSSCSSVPHLLWPVDIAVSFPSFSSIILFDLSGCCFFFFLKWTVLLEDVLSEVCSRLT